MIPESDVEKAVDYLRQSAREAAQARANVRYLETFLKTLKAQLKVKETALSNAAAEDVALASVQFREALEGYKAAVEADAFHLFKREAASALIEAWRTQCATARAEGKAYS
jgi:hypothetical protein